jgi:hypothetical protein
LVSGATFSVVIVTRPSCMNAGEISELSRNVICSGFEKSRPGPTRYRFELGCAVYSVHEPARVDANTTLPSGAKTGSKL